MEKKIKNANRLLLLLIFIFGVFTNFSMAANSDVSYADEKQLTLNAENITLQQAIQRIQDQSEFDFFYKNVDLEKTQKKVSFAFEGKTIHEVLPELLSGTNLAYKVMEKDVVIFPSSSETVKENDASTDEARQQEIEVSGTVTDAQTGEPLPGVNIVVQGTTIGTTTDMDGNYSIEAPEDATLVFSFVGYQEVAMDIEGRQQIDVEMEQAVTELEEVVAVGYGSQKRSNISGSVTDIEGEALEDEPVAQASAALQGDISGISIRQQGGAPGRESADIRIRGFQTFSGAGNNPLILIDGVPGSLDNVNPANIENISVLKDASSAAIYGSRAANGVILVETAQGEAGTMNITYNGYVGVGEMQNTPRFADSWEYAIARNEALEYMGAGKEFTQEEIEKFRSGELPNDHHYEMAFDNYAPQTKHNLKISGGSEDNQYMFSVGYTRKDGLLQNNLYDSYSKNLENWMDRYQLRLNVNSELHDRLHAEMNLSGDYSKDIAPGAFTGDGTMERLVTRITRQPSTDAARIPAGDEKSSTGYFYAHVDRGVPWGSIDSENHENDRDWNFNGKAQLTYDVANSLEITGRAGYTFDYSKYKKFRSYFIARPYLTQKPSRLYQSMGRSDEMMLEALARYDNTFQESHEINVIAGYSQTEHRGEWVSAYRDRFPNNQLYQIGAASSANQQSNASASEWALQSYFMRANYSYEGKYMLEANARYDGSSRFAPENRYGFFPSFSGAWRISEENFIQESAPWIYDLKLRGSWGQLGNQQIGAYPYQATVNLGQEYVFGNSVVDGAEIGTVPNRGISWETTTITNVGLDISLFEGQLSASVDHFKKITSDILYGISTAGVLGMGSSDVNAGEVQNVGWDFEVSYQGSSGNFTYGFAPNFSTVNTEVLSLARVERDIGQNLFVGEPLNAIYGYKDDGLFVDEQDIESYPDQPYDPRPGDIRYKDLNGDGKVTPEDDRTVIGQTSPKYTYGGNLRLGYKNINLKVTFYGAGGMRRELEHYTARAFANGSNVQKWMFENRWTEENPDRDAIYPRMKIHGEGHGGPYSWHSTYWAWDASYLKIKTLRIGYDLPSSLIEPWGISNFRVYASSRNLVSFDNYVPGWDPEMQVVGWGGGKHYPNMRVYSLGVNVQF